MSRMEWNDSGRKKFHTVLFTLIILTVFMALAALCIGRYTLSVPEVVRIIASRFMSIEADWGPQAESVVLNLRLPRIAGSFLVGGSLALAGAAYQGIFKNPLVSPDLLGVSSGACVGAASAILLGFHAVAIQFSAFFMGIITVFLVMLLPRILKNDSITVLVLSGVIVSGVMNALMGMLKYVADPETELAAITYWQLGSMAKVMNSDVIMVVPLIIISVIVVLVLRWRINLLSLGEAEAKTMGVNTKRLRWGIIVCSTMLTACSVCLCGTVGWIGLVIPHLSRMFVGPNTEKSLPVAFVLGGVFLMLIDTMARSLTSGEIPLSVLTGLIGAPFFFYVLSKQRTKLS